MNRTTITRSAGAVLAMSLSAAPVFADGMMKKGMDDAMAHEMAMEKKGMMQGSGEMRGDDMMKKDAAMETKMSDDTMMEGGMKKSMQ